MTWIQTFTGRKFYPLAPNADDIDIVDIAHSLSLQCRYTGHCKQFYSVAEHSVHVAMAASRDNRLWALLHDASEAYLTDVPRPIKPAMTEYKAMEGRVMFEVCRKFKLPRVMPQEVKDLDARILHDEMRQIMGPPPEPWQDMHPSGLIGIKLPCWPPAYAKYKFLELYLEITS